MLVNLPHASPMLPLPGARLGYWAGVSSKALLPALNMTYSTFVTPAPVVRLYLRCYKAQNLAVRLHKVESHMLSYEIKL